MYIHLRMIMEKSFASADIYPAGQLSTPLSALQLYAGGPPSTIKFGATGTAPNTRHIKVRVNGVEVKDTTMDYFNDLVTTAPVDNSTLLQVLLRFSLTIRVPTLSTGCGFPFLS
jgi:hypothetical protein